jgi:hypothetical protein
MEGFGLQGMQERITALAGDFWLITEPGKGCQKWHDELISYALCELLSQVNGIMDCNFFLVNRDHFPFAQVSQ